MAAAGSAAPLEAEDAEFQTSKSIKVSAVCVCSAGIARRWPGFAGRRACGRPWSAGAKSSRSCAPMRPVRLAGRVAAAGVVAAE